MLSRICCYNLTTQEVCLGKLVPPLPRRNAYDEYSQSVLYALTPGCCALSDIPPDLDCLQGALGLLANLKDTRKVK